MEKAIASLLLPLLNLYLYMYSLVNFISIIRSLARTQIDLVIHIPNTYTYVVHVHVISYHTLTYQFINEKWLGKRMFLSKHRRCRHWFVLPKIQKRTYHLDWLKGLRFRIRFAASLSSIEFVGKWWLIAIWCAAAAGGTENSCWLITGLELFKELSEHDWEFGIGMGKKNLFLADNCMDYKLKCYKVITSDWGWFIFALCMSMNYWNFAAVWLLHYLKWG